MLADREISVSTPEAKAYLISEEYILLKWRNRIFMIYPADKWVGTPSDYRNRFLGARFWPVNSSLVFWPRGSYESVPVGDAIKGEPREKYEFKKGKISILAFSSSRDARGTELIISMPNAK